MSEKEFLPVKSDVIFRLFFADERNMDYLIGFLKSVLKLPEDDYDVIEITDPHLLREFDGDKLAIIDVKLRTKSNKIIHIEVQLLSEKSDNTCYPYKNNIRVETVKQVKLAS